MQDSTAGEGLATSRSLRGLSRIYQKTILMAIVISGILWILDVPGRLHVTLWKQQYIGLFMALVLASVFLGVLATKKQTRHKIPWYDFVLALAGLAVGLYIAFWYPAIYYKLGQPPTPQTTALGVVMVLLTLEALRRLFGWVLVILLSLFFFYGGFTDLFPGFLYGRVVSLSWYFTFLYMDASSFMYLVSIGATMILAFVLFGELLFEFGGGKVFTDLALSLAGRFSGGPAKVSIVGSSLFGTISGSAVANILVVGTTTIPLMKNTGYKSHIAAAIETCSSVGGMIMPPVMGVVAFVMADIIGVPYSKVAIAAFIPAVLYYATIFIQVHLEAVKSGLKGLPPSEIPQLKSVLKRVWLIVIPLGFLIYALFVVGMEPEAAALYATFVGFAVTPLLKENRAKFWRRSLAVLEKTGRDLLAIAMLLVGAGFIVAIINSTGLGLKVSLALLRLSGGNPLLLLLVGAVASMIIGTAADILASYILVAMLIAPTLTQFGFPILAVHLFCLYYGVLAELTPPVGISAFVASGIAGSSPMRTLFKASQLAILAYIVPFLFVYNPALLLNGPVLTILVEFITGILAALALGTALIGFFTRNLPWFTRLILFFGAAALFLSIAVKLMPEGLILKTAGFLLVIPVLIREWKWGADMRLRRLAGAVATDFTNGISDR